MTAPGLNANDERLLRQWDEHAARILTTVSPGYEGERLLAARVAALVEHIRQNRPRIETGYEIFDDGQHRHTNGDREFVLTEGGDHRFFGFKVGVIQESRQGLWQKPFVIFNWNCYELGDIPLFRAMLAIAHEKAQEWDAVTGQSSEPPTEPPAA